MGNKIVGSDTRWILGFILFNSLLYMLLGLTFILNANYNDSWATKIFLLIADIGHMGFMPILLYPLLYIIYKITHKKSLTLVIGSLLSVLGLIYLMVDSVVYAQFRFHLNKFVFNMVFSSSADEIFQFPTWMYFIALLTLFFLIATQFVISRYSYIIRSKKSSIFLIGIIICLFSNHIVYAVSNAVFYHPVSQVQKVFPLYFPLTANSLLSKFDLVDRDKLKNKKTLSNKGSKGAVNYPKNELKFKDASKYNVLFVFIDCWRGDCLNETITPNAFNLSKKSQVFTDHYSGSSGTRSSVFSFFYSLPAFAYWETMKGLNKGPVFMKTILEQDYKMGVFASASISNPPFDITVFSDVENLRTNTKTEINTPWARDEKSTEEWLDFIDKYKKNNETKPFFGFLFYDGVHGYSSEKPGEGPFQPAWKEANYLALNNESDPNEFFNLYKNVLHEADERVGTVLRDLEDKGLMENTIVVLTGDHGQEFNDNKKNYWSHGGNYTKAQTHVPLAIYWPNMEAKHYYHKSLHYDVIPTLMSNNQGCINQFNDYGIGKSLFDTSEPNFYVAGAFETYAIVEKDKIITVNYSGNYSVTDLHMNILENQSIDGARFGGIFKSINRFYQ
ncbi:DUF3413 domain-containing protein [Ancylomarina sp. YFZ004]